MPIFVEINRMESIDIIYFVGPWNLIFGFAISFCIQISIRMITEVTNNPEWILSIDNIWNIDILKMILFGIGFWLITVIFHTLQYIFLRKRKFAPDKQNSKDKNKAMYQNVDRRLLSNVPDEFTVGKYRGKYFKIPIDTHDVTHCLVFGSPGSFKSSTLLNSLIWNFNFEKQNKMTVFAIDVKPELSLKSVDEHSSHVHVFNPSTTNGYGWNAWYGLDENSMDDQLIERADMIARALIANPGGNGDNEFFYISAQNLMVPFLVYGFRKGYGFVETILQIIQIPLQDYIATIMMDDLFADNHPKIIGMLRPYEGKDSESMQDIELTLRQDLRIWDTDSVKYQFDENPNKASPEDLINEISVFVALPDNLIKQYSPIFRLVTQMVLNYLASIPESKRADNDVPLIWLLIDEFGSIGKISIQEPLARLRSRKVSIWLACQGLSQLDAAYGHDGTRAILDNTETTLVFSCKDKSTAEMLSAWCGQYKETKVSKNKKPGTFANDEYSLTTSSEYRNVMEISDIMALRKNKELLVFHEGNRYLVDKCPYWMIPKLKEKSDQIKRLNQKESD